MFGIGIHVRRYSHSGAEKMGKPKSEDFSTVRSGTTKPVYGCMAMAAMAQHRVPKKLPQIIAGR